MFSFKYWGMIFRFRIMLSYLDAGTGSLIIQMLIGGLAGILLALKLFWHKIVRIFKHDNSGKKEKKAGDNQIE
jgi:hypothetical protein